MALLRGGQFATPDWVDWYNTCRLLEPIGNVPPAEAEARYFAQIEGQALAAQLKPNGLWKTGCGSLVMFCGLLALSAGIVVLFNDYRRWQEGAKDTLIPWDKCWPAIQATLNALQRLWEGFDRVHDRAWLFVVVADAIVIDAASCSQRRHWR
ncbi:hypothetical protein MPOCJGCO_4676 [Methylobacterium trifolii]|uniref:Uncharacterized protein n=1 Tax=Methylobacterium trifolii TaxID=1003092 RepID=A0ABQ4U824_9HYPH|nr:hypothetical protein MPOCJGCO_4676 [Methylobacterium trifolii]